MATETKYPDAILEQSGWTATPAVTSIDEDPDAPGADWIVAASTTTDPIVRVSFPTPSGPLTSGTQTFKAYVRKNGGTGTPTVRLDLYENGTLKTSGTAVGVTSTSGQLVSQNFSGLDTSLANPDGSNVEIRVVVTHAGGSGGARASVDLNAVNWDTVTYSASLSLPVGIVRENLQADPPRTPVLDDFNRADTTIVDDALWFGGSTHLLVSSNQLTSDATGGTTKTKLSAGNQEWYWTVVSVGTASILRLWACVTGPLSSTPSGYLAEVSTTGQVTLKRYDAGATTTLDTSAAGDIAAGDVQLIRAYNGHVEVWRKRSGTWTLIANAEDDTYLSGVGGIGVFAPSWIVDDFGGGELAPVYGADVSLISALALDPGAVSSGEALQGINLAASGSAALAPGAVASGAATRGADVAASGSVSFPLGQVASAETVYGLDIASGAAPLLLGRIAPSASLHGLDLVGSGVAALLAGAVPTAALARGADLAGSGSVALLAGALASGEALHGADIVGAGQAVLAPGAVASGESLAGFNLTGSGTAALTIAAVASAAALQGVDLAGSGVASLLLAAVPTDELVHGVGLGGGAGGLLLGFIASGAALHGADLAPGPVGLSIGSVASGANVLGVDLSIVGAAVLHLGAITSQAALHGIDLAGSGSAVLTPGQVASAELLRGLGLAGTGSVGLGLGAVPSGATVRGADLLTAVLLALGKIDTAAAVYGADLAPGAVALPIGHVLSGAALRGLDLAGAGVAPLAIGLVPGAAVLHGIDLAEQGFVHSAVLVMAAPSIAMALSAPTIEASGKVPTLATVLTTPTAEGEVKVPVILIVLE